MILSLVISYYVLVSLLCEPDTLSQLFELHSAMNSIPILLRPPRDI